MTKNWLIRTKSNHILGPISKEKALDLYKNGSIKADDEICSGNGYWFFIREDDLVKKYLLGDEQQCFNPVSEAKDTISRPTKELTVVGLNISALMEKDNLPKDPGIDSIPNTLENLPAGSKKKNNLEKKTSSQPVNKNKKLKKQNFLKYIGIIGFIILFLLIYYRKTVIKSLFKGEMISHISLFSAAYADSPKSVPKKRILDSKANYEKVVFSPVIGFDGFRVISSFNIEEVACSEFENEVYQLGVLLYSPDLINENFLIKLRDCVVKLSAEHPLKRWMKWIGKTNPLSPEIQNQNEFLQEIINSQYNLITDLKIKEKITGILSEMPEFTIPEKLLKSYLYLIIGNVSRSDRIFQNFSRLPPKENWIEGHHFASSYHNLSKLHIKQILKKLDKHPADRSEFQLFLLYIKSYFNDELMLDEVSEFSTSAVESKFDLQFYQEMAPELISFSRLMARGENRRFELLRDESRYPLDMQSYWVWAFTNINPLISDSMNETLKKLEKKDELWFIYLLSNERLADSYYKAGKSFLPARREFLKKVINEKKFSMMAIYKLIEIGDISEDLVTKVTDLIVNESAL